MGDSSMLIHQRFLSLGLGGVDKLAEASGSAIRV